MEDLSTYSEHDILSVCNRFSTACKLLCIDDDDPLGSPEKTVTINDDWTVSRDESLPVICYDSENEAEEDDGRSSEEAARSEDDLPVENLRTRRDHDDDDDTSLHRTIDYRSSLQNNSSSGCEDQIVPLKPLSGATGQPKEKTNKRFLEENEDRIRKDIVGKKMAISVASMIKEIEDRSPLESTLVVDKTEEIERQSAAKRTSVANKIEEIENRSTTSWPP